MPNSKPIEIPKLDTMEDVKVGKSTINMKIKI